MNWGGWTGEERCVTTFPGFLHVEEGNSHHCECFRRSSREPLMWCGGQGTLLWGPLLSALVPSCEILHNRRWTQSLFLLKLPKLIPIPSCPLLLVPVWTLWHTTQLSPVSTLFSWPSCEVVRNWFVFKNLYRKVIFLLAQHSEKVQPHK